LAIKKGIPRWVKADSCFAALRRVAQDALKVTFDPTLKLEFHGYFRFWVDLATKFVKNTSDYCNFEGDFDIIAELKGLVV